MWQKSYSKIVKNLEPHQVWKVWSDINLRTQWDDDTEWARIDGPFKKNAHFYMKIKNGPELKLEITECIPNEKFTDTYYFPLARLDGIHEVKKTSEGLSITTTIKVTGLLQWLWSRLVAKKIVATLPHQTDLLIQLAGQQQ